MPRRPYLALMISPCSVSAQAAAHSARAAPPGSPARVLPPPRLIVPPRPWKRVQRDVRGVGAGLDQRRLGPVQRPARGREAAVLVAVGVAEHHHLRVRAARRQVARGRRDRRAAPPARRRRGLEVVDRLEQRRDVERHAARRRSTRPPPARQQQHREHVVGALGHADDVGADGAPPVALAALGDGAEDLERLGLARPASGTGSARGPRPPRARGAGARRAPPAGARRPGRRRRAAGRRPAGGPRASWRTSSVARWKPKVSTRRSSRRTANSPACARGSRARLRGDQAQVGEELAGASRRPSRPIGAGAPRGAGRSAQEQAVGHVAVARRHASRGLSPAAARRSSAAIRARARRTNSTRAWDWLRCSAELASSRGSSPRTSARWRARVARMRRRPRRWGCRPCRRRPRRRSAAGSLERGDRGRRAVDLAQGVLERLVERPARCGRARR